jgi:hypothetical protein
MSFKWINAKVVEPKVWSIHNHYPFNLKEKKKKWLFQEPVILVLYLFKSSGNSEVLSCLSTPENQ